MCQNYAYNIFIPKAFDVMYGPTTMQGILVKLCVTIDTILPADCMPKALLLFKNFRILQALNASVYVWEIVWF